MQRRAILKAIGATGTLTVASDGFIQLGAADDGSDGPDCSSFGCDGNPPGIVTLSGGSRACPARYHIAVSGVIINADSGPDVDYDDRYYTSVSGTLEDEAVTYRFSGHITKFATNDSDLTARIRQERDQ